MEKCKSLKQTCNGCKAFGVNALFDGCSLGYTTGFNDNLEMLPKEPCEKPCTTEEYTQCLKVFYERKIKTNPESMLNATCFGCGRQLFGIWHGDPCNWLVLNKEYTKGGCFDCHEIIDRFLDEF